MMIEDYYGAFRKPAYNMFDSRLAPQVMGQFDPMNFVLRVDSSIYDVLNSGGPTQAFFTQRGDPRTYAFATYLHEIFHWWQHIGTTIGLLTGLSIPVQSHINKRILKESFNEIGPSKPLVHQALDNKNNPASLNTVVNNWMDVEFSYGLLSYPEDKARDIVNSRFFECFGHALEVHLVNTVGLLSACFDPDFTALPDIRNFESGFELLRQNKVPMHYYGSKTILPPVGMHDILEGQARFQELQYRHIASKAKLSWDDFEQQGLMGQSYTKAFRAFLEITNFPFPRDPMSEIVNLFLLLCDISLNPSCGYPDDITDYERFINDISPGIRFISAGHVVRAVPGLLHRTVFPGKDDYEKVTQTICHSLGWKTPGEVSASISSLSKRLPGIQSLEQEALNWEFTPAGMSVRFIYAKHLSLMKDKSLYPEYFCWPVIYFSDIGDRPSALKLALMERHNPPFIAESMDGPVKANFLGCPDSSKEVKVLSTYFLSQIMYDITRQWIVKPGKFSFKYPWSGDFRDDEFQAILNAFRFNYGYDLHSISPHPT